MDTPEDDEDRDWKELTTAEFLKGYAESDAIYDEYDLRPDEDTPKPHTELLRADHEHH